MFVVLITSQKPATWLKIPSNMKSLLKKKKKKALSDRSVSLGG